MPDAPINFRATGSDREIIARLTEKLGINVSGLIRMALRRLDEQESKRRERNDAGVRDTRKG